jgi:signal transduction histidine kinase
MVVSATEDERKRISKDLHDGIGQQLSALKLALQNFQNQLENNELKKQLGIISQRFSRSADEVRSISHQMMPRSLMEMGLLSAVEDLLRSSFQFSKIDYEFEHYGIDGRFQERIEISLYRILQELVNNIIKHSEATTVHVQLLKTGGKLILIVEDNGRGLSNQEISGHGLLNIKNRLDIIKGKVNYEPSPNSGTLATVTIPLS